MQGKSSVDLTRVYSITRVFNVLIFQQQLSIESIRFFYVSLHFNKNEGVFVRTK